MATLFAPPSIYAFPPFFTLQLHEETLARQLQLWSDIVLSYCTSNRLFTLNSSLPVFSNSSIGRRVRGDLFKAIIECMLGRRLLTKHPSIAGDYVVWWRSIEDWSSALYQYAQETGNVGGAIMTVYELVEGEDSVGQVFHGIPEIVWRPVFKALERDGRAKLFGEETAQSAVEIGVKF